MKDIPVQEEGTSFAPKFNENGLIPVITTDVTTGEVLMLAWMNRQAFDMTLDTGKVHYWSRSRNCLWQKGEASGNFQIVRDIRVDCDQDTLWIIVEQQGGCACHTGRKSCFYRRLSGKDSNLIFLED